MLAYPTKGLFEMSWRKATCGATPREFTIVDLRNAAIFSGTCTIVSGPFPCYLTG